MTKTECTKFLKRVKSYYTIFPLEDYVISEWHAKLKTFDIAKAHKQLDYHLAGQYHQEPPKLYFFAKSLAKQRGNEKLKGYVSCSHCNAKFSVSDMSQWLACEDRCRRKEYINKMVRKYKINGHDYFPGSEITDSSYQRFLEVLKQLGEAVIDNVEELSIINEKRAEMKLK